jgi:hypothetical protein
MPDPRCDACSRAPWFGLSDERLPDGPAAWQLSDLRSRPSIDTATCFTDSATGTRASVRLEVTARDQGIAAPEDMSTTVFETTNLIGWFVNVEFERA